MEARGRQYSSIKSIFALLTVNLLALSTAEYVHQHRHGIQSKIYEHPRFGESSIRYCAFNQYFDDREGRCMIIPGGGIAISIDESTTCSTEALRGHPHRSRNYYICRKSNTILAECGRGKRFENRLKRCTIDTRPNIDEEDYDSHHHPYDHLHLPACQRSGRFPVPQDNCTSFYTCTSNGFRFFRSIHKCPPSTGFDPFDEICTTERACYNDELVSTTAVDDRAEMFGSTIGLMFSTAAGPSVDETQLTHTLKDNYSLNTSTTRFAIISDSPSLSTSGYREANISVSFIPPNTSTTEKITTATTFPDSIDDVVGIARPTSVTTHVYEQGDETSPFTSTTYVQSFGLSEQTNTSERSRITVAADEIVDTSTANSVLSDHESTASTSRTMNGILYNRYSDDYVTSRNRESSTDTTVKVATNNKNDEFTVATNEIVDTSTTNSVLLDNESTANTSGTNSDQFLPISTSKKKDEFTDQPTIDDLGTRKRDETRTSEANELGIGSQVFHSTESAMDNASEKWLFGKNMESATSTTTDEIPRREITDRELGFSLPVLLSSATSDGSTRDIQYKEAQFTTTPSGISSIDRSSDFIEGSEIKSTSGRITLDDAVTLTTPVDSYASSGEVTPSSRQQQSTTAGMESAMSTTEPTYITEGTEKFDLPPVSPSSLTTRSNEATSTQDSNWTTEEESTIADRYTDTVSSFSTDTPDNEKSTTAGMESAMSTTEPTYITEVTEKFDLPPVSPSSLTTLSNEATSTQDSDWTTEEESTIADHDHGTFSSLFTDTPDNEKSTNAGTESTISTTEPVNISEVTEKVGTHSEITWNSATDDLLTSVEQNQSTTSENPYSSFTYTSTLGVSQFGTAQTTGNSNPEMNVAVSTTSITPSLSSEPSHLQDGQAPTSYTSASNGSEYPTTIEPSAGSTNSLSTTMISSD